MDYGMLSRCSIQSTSDQEDYRYYATISANAPLAVAMEQARLSSDDYYLFSATSFEPALEKYVTLDPRFKLINMNEL